MIEELRETKIPGCFEIKPKIFKDHRGAFVKTYHENVFHEHNLNRSYKEEFYSISNRGVFRGLHFQMPPKAVAKLVYCVVGNVSDIVLDLRRGSPTYGQIDIIELSEKKGNLLYIPEGLAHGFFVNSDKAIMLYKVSEIYYPELDTGILYSSVDLPFDGDAIVISNRDLSFPKIDDFHTPFVYDARKP